MTVWTGRYHTEVVKKNEGIVNRGERMARVSYNQKCRMSYFQDSSISVVNYIKFIHEKNRQYATELLEYKPWLSSETIAQIEEIRNSNLPDVIISLTHAIGKDLLDNEATREMLAGQVYDMWALAKSIKC